MRGGSGRREPNGELLVGDSCGRGLPSSGRRGVLGLLGLPAEGLPSPGRMGMALQQRQLKPTRDSTDLRSPWLPLQKMQQPRGGGCSGGGGSSWSRLRLDAPNVLAKLSQFYSFLSRRLQVPGRQSVVLKFEPHTHTHSGDEHKAQAAVVVDGQLPLDLQVVLFSGRWRGFFPLPP